jgi:hypothetical protein
MASPTYHLESRGGSAGGSVALFEGNNKTDGSGSLFVMSGVSYNGIFSVKNGVGDYDTGINLIQDGASADRRYSLVAQAISGNFLINTDTNNITGNLASSSNNLITIQPGGNVGIGVTAPAGRVEIAAGSATPGTAPIKLNSGTLNTVPVTGCLEFDGNNLFITI